MPRVLTQKAGKDYPDQGIKKGEKYYKWSFRYGGTHKSKTYPRASQLTQSKYSDVYAAQENVSDVCAANDCALQDIIDACRDAADQIRTVGEEYLEADEAMGGHQSGSNYERSEYCEQGASDYEELADTFEGIEFGEDEDFATEADAIDEIRNLASDVQVDEA